MQINLLITYVGQQPKEVVAISPEFVAFEREFNQSIASLSNEKDIRYTYLCFLAWHAEKRTKATELDFDAWLEGVEIVTGEEKKSKA